jgi:SPP1 gp7 family putative phage head morphogenesis protein
MDLKKFNTRYLRAQEILKTRDLSKIFSRQKEGFCDLLEGVEKKSGNDDIWEYVNRMNQEDVAYLISVLRPVIKQGAKPEILKYKNQLPVGYSTGFDLPTAPASKYLRDLKELHLSQRDGSISKTTNDEIRNLIREGLDRGDSYGEIAQEIRKTDPFVFSKSRANLIAVQELGQAYGFWNFQPAKDMQKQGYVMAKQWQAKKDMRTRPTHAQNEADWVIPLDQPFSGTGDQSAPSQEFRCRCTSSTEIVGIQDEKWLKMLKKYENLRKNFEIET